MTVMDTTMTFRLPTEQAEHLRMLSSIERVPIAQILRQAIADRLDAAVESGTATGDTVTIPDVESLGDSPDEA